ncbi:hypothetical protein PLESTB_001056700 [Pleodorina starrii]|uniref:Protein kinase domain-containing protein n=1 Tax=Pleodorina starrii TaxID=330485 RepID=A0A9W6BPS8_9CHLO|nr:hypothetical protein PLESTB_001056700 [Pleodorina starrii]
MRRVCVTFVVGSSSFLGGATSGMKAAIDGQPCMVQADCSRARPRWRLVLVLLLLCFAPAWVRADDPDVSASTPEELRAALLSGATGVVIAANMVFNSTNWPDPPVTISKPVIIYSLFRHKLDFCGSDGAAARVLINVTASGSLLLRKVFLRNFLPSRPQNLSGLGPVPAVLSSGGQVTFRLVVFHFLPAVTWAFSAPPADSFWAGEGRAALSSVYSGAGLQLQQPALYLVKFTSAAGSPARYAMDTCYSPMDLASCYGDDAEDTTLVYCLYTLADSLVNPAVRNIRVFHDIGMDRTAYSRLKPILVTRPKSYAACPGSRPSINMQRISGAVAIRAAVEFRGLRFKGSLPTNFTSWPAELPLLLSVFDVDGAGVVSLYDTVVDVPDLGRTVEVLRSLPGNDSAADPTRPHLQPAVDAWPSQEVLARAAAMAAAPVGGGVIYDAWHPDGGADGGAGDGWPGLMVRQWVLERNTWQQYAAAGALNAYEALNSPSAGAWRFERVFVRQADNANERALCFGAALEQGAVMAGGVPRVADEVQLRAALARGARYVQVVADIKLTAANWPGGDAALVLDEGIIEVRGCHPLYGQRFVVDLSDLKAVVRAKGALMLQGDLRLGGLGWRDVQPGQLLSVASGTSDVSPLGAFALAANGAGSLELEGVEADGLYDPAGAFRPTDLLAVLHLNHMTPQIRARNASLRSDERGVSLGFWRMLQSQLTGLWVFTDTEITWAPAAAAAAASGGGGGGGGGDRAPLAAIVVPCVVVGVLLLAAVPIGLSYRRARERRRRRRRCGDELGLQAPSKLAAAAAAGQQQQQLTPPPQHPCGDDSKSASAAAAAAVSMAEALAAVQSSGGDGTTDSDAAAALAAVLEAANKIMTSNANSNASASGCTRTDVSGVAAALGQRGRSDKGGGGGGGGGGRQDHGQGHALARVEAADSRGKGPLGEINAAKRELMAGRHVPSNHTGAALVDDLVLQAVLGEGSYGRVYRALWRGTTVAVKVILLPAHMSGRERHERMAVMEAAISSSLSHPNIVQTYTYGVEGAKGRRTALRMAGSVAHSALPEASTSQLDAAAAAAAGGRAGPSANGARREANGGSDAELGECGGDIVAWEIRLVQEYCDLGSLRDKLNDRAFFRPAPAPAGAGSPPSPSSPRLAGAGAGSPLPSAEVIAEEPQGEAEAGAEVPEVPEASGAGEAAEGGEESGERREAADAAVPEATAALPPRWDVRSGSGAAAAAVEGGSGGGSGGERSSWAPPPPPPSPPPPPALVVDLPAVLDTAIDVARALAHLHACRVVHADLKPRNVLLKGSTTDPRGFVAKVADFGLSMRLNPDETHVSNAFHGTLAYMAPETLLHGHVSRASDVYSFGILLYELYTGDTAFRGVPKALIGHAITKENLRPVFPPALGAPFEYQLLACRCWESNPEIRPEFDFILEDLKRMRLRLCASAPSCGSIGPSSGPTAAAAGGGGAGGGGAGGGLPEPAAGRLWGLPVLSSQRMSQQGARFAAAAAQGPNYHLRPGFGPGYTDGDHSLSASNSVTMSSISALTSPHNATSTYSAATAGGGLPGGGGGGGVAAAGACSGYGHGGYGGYGHGQGQGHFPGGYGGYGQGNGGVGVAGGRVERLAGVARHFIADGHGSGGPPSRIRTAPYPACLGTTPAEVVDEEEAAAAVQSL